MPTSMIKFDRFFEAFSAACAVLDKDLRFVACNDEYCETLRRPREELLGTNIFEAFPGPDDMVARLREMFEAAVSGERHMLKDIPYTIARSEKDGGGEVQLYWRIHVGPLPVDDKAPHMWMLRMEDVTEDVKDRHQRDTISSELQHRMGNLLNLVMTIARRTAASTPDIDDFLASYGARINSLSRTYSALTGRNWSGLTLREIAEQEFAAFDENADNLVIDGPDLKLSANEAQATAMALHELTTNAAKYGALHQPNGHLRLAWTTTDDNGFELEWKESGLNDLREPDKEGFGSMILTRVLPSQVNGKAERKFEGDSFTYRLKVPSRDAVSA